MLKNPLGTSTAALIMVFVMLPFFLLAMYERNGQPLEKVVRNMANVLFIRSKQRPYRTNDMYPQFWTTGIGGILMKYSYEYKKKCVALYREGKWAETPEGVSQKRFHDNIREWVRVEEAKGPEGLQHKNQNKVWTAEEKYAPITKVLAGASVTSTAISEGIRPGLLHQWVRCYKIKGYEGLVAQRKGRPPKEPDMKKKVVPVELTPSEREEMIRLRAENEYLRAENEVIKKEIALKAERCAAQLKAKKLRSSWKHSLEG